MMPTSPGLKKSENLLTEKIQLIFNDFDFIITSHFSGYAFKAGEKINDPIAMYLADIYTVMANLAGIPAISLPLFKHTNGMPFGLQVMSNRFNELPLLRFSDQLMQGNKATLDFLLKVPRLVPDSCNETNPHDAEKFCRLLLAYFYQFAYAGYG